MDCIKSIESSMEYQEKVRQCIIKAIEDTKPEGEARERQ